MEIVGSWGWIGSKYRSSLDLIGKQARAYCFDGAELGRRYKNPRLVLRGSLRCYPSLATPLDMNFFFLFTSAILLFSLVWGDALTVTVESCPNNSVAPVIHSPQCFTCPYIASFHAAVGNIAHICFEESSTSPEYNCMCGNLPSSHSTWSNADTGVRYGTAGYTNSNGEVVPPREIGQCLYSVYHTQAYVILGLLIILQDQGYVHRVDHYGSQMAPECPSRAPQDTTC